MIFAFFSVTIEKVTVLRSPDKGVALPSTTCVVPSSRVTALPVKSVTRPDWSLRNEILGCAQNQTAGLAFKEIGPYLKLIVADIITTPTGKRTDDQGSFPQAD